jgi:hypothetical protein
VGGGESGWATPDPVDPNIIWSSASGSGSVGGIVERFDLRNGQMRRVEVWPDQTNGSPAADLKYRFVWTFPLTISPHDRRRVFLSHFRDRRIAQRERTNLGWNQRWAGPTNA